MKKWFEFFGLSFFSHSLAKTGVKRGYVNVFLSFVLVLVFLWAGFAGANVLPFGSHYKNAPDFKESVHSVFANSDADKRIEAEITEGKLKAKKHGGEYAECLLVNTFENEADKQNYLKNGYNVVVDTRPADTLAEVKAYCVSNDGKSTEISYEDYLALSDVARLNFDFKLKYTGNELKIDATSVEAYKEYLGTLSGEVKDEVARLSGELSENKITESEYNRAIYELYFTNYYPEITAYESTSKVPLLRNYYYHSCISLGVKNYLFIFDDYMTGSFETHRGILLSFYGYYGRMDNRVVVKEGVSESEAKLSVDAFIKDAFKSTVALNLYASAVNVFSLIPFIALMLLVVTLLTYSISKLRGVESIASFGAMLKVVGSFAWFSGIASALFTVIAAFFLKSNIIGALPLVVFFAMLAGRSVIFAIKESQLYMKRLEQEEVTQTEV